LTPILRYTLFAALLFLSLSVLLAGRSIRVGFGAYTTSMYYAYTCMALALLFLGLWCTGKGAWRWKEAIPILLVLTAVAHGLCEWKERRFVQQYASTGSMPQPRYFDSSSWLSFDRTTGVLHGSD